MEDTRIYKLDPRHKNLLKDKTSGYWWLRPRTRRDKYKGRIIFVSNMSEALAKAVEKTATARRVHKQLIRFERHGYIFSGLDIIQLLSCKSATLANSAKAHTAKTEMVFAMKQEAKKQAAIKSSKTKFGPDYVPPTTVRQNLGSKGPMSVWLWNFENPSLGKSFKHIFSFKDEGAEVGKSRRLFADTFGLRYVALQQLASGVIDSHRGWRRSEPPRKVSYREAIRMKIEELRK